jgi:hypothetical protein
LIVAITYSLVLTEEGVYADNSVVMTCYLGFVVVGVLSLEDRLLNVHPDFQCRLRLDVEVLAGLEPIVGLLTKSDLNSTSSEYQRAGCFDSTSSTIARLTLEESSAIDVAKTSDLSSDLPMVGDASPKAVIASMTRKLPI